MGAKCWYKGFAAMVGVMLVREWLLDIFALNFMLSFFSNTTKLTFLWFFDLNKTDTNKWQELQWRGRWQRHRLRLRPSK